MSGHHTSRRGFLQRSIAAAGSLALPGIASARLFGAEAPSERIGIAMLGVGSRGSTVLREFAKQGDTEILAVCDPFRERRERARETLEKEHGRKGITASRDFREILGRPDIDAVVCCTCDHWHVPIGIAAARAGKDMYIEKPLGPSLGWSRELRKAVRRHGRVFQYGTQQRSQQQFRYAVEVVRNGYLGEVRRVEAWCIDGARARDWFEPKSKVAEPVPDGLDYDLWLGPAPYAPYNHYRVHREGSFHTYDYSLGFIAGWGAHPLDIAQWGLKADSTGPVQVEGTGKLPQMGGLFTTIYDWDVRCEYANGIALHFLSYSLAKPVIERYRRRVSDHGTTFFGEDGWISVDRQGLEASDPRLLAIRFKPSDERLRVSRGHDRDFLDCVRSREPTLNPIDSAVRSDTISHLSNVAIRAGRAIRWDPLAEEVVGDDAANRMLCRAARAPYTF